MLQDGDKRTAHRRSMPASCTRHTEQSIRTRASQTNTHSAAKPAQSGNRPKLTRSRKITLLVADIVCIMLAVALAFSSVGAAFASGTSNNPTSGAQLVAVPNVANMTLAQAKQELQANNLNWVLAQGASDKATAKVSGTDPWVGTMVPQGTTVVVYTQDIVPKIVDMQLGYYTGRTLTYTDGHQEPEISWFDPEELDYQFPWIESRGGKLQLACRVKWNTTGSYVLSTAADGIAASDIRWGSSNETVATVDNTGIVQATGLANEPVVITCTLMNKTYIPDGLAANETIHAQITVQLAGQRGEYPEEVVVVDENGKALGEGGVILDNEDGTSYAQLYVRVRYNDGLGNISYKVTSPGCGENCVKGTHQHVSPSEIEGLSWRLGDSSSSQSIVSINETDGIVTPLPGVAGTAQAVASVLGGKEGPVEGYTWVIVKGFTDAPPAESLTVRVVYDMDRNTTVSQGYYTPSTLANASGGNLYRAAYTQSKTSGAWRTVSAEGVKLRDILADVGVTDLSQVQSIIKSATDGVSNALTSGPSLFNRASYYFPNFDQVDSRGNHNLSGAQMVEPMVALRSYWAEQSSTTNFTDMNESNCFELLVGNNGTDNDIVAAENSTYKMYEMLVILQGGPTIGNNNQGEGNGDGNGQGTGTGNGNGQGTGTGTGNSQGNGNSQAGGAGSNPSDPSNSQVEGGQDAAGAATAGTSAENQQTEAQATPEVQNDSQPDAEQPQDQPLPETSRKQRVYQYMNRAQNNLDYDFDNPLSPFFLPSCCGVALVGGAAARENLRRQMGFNTLLNRAQQTIGSKLQNLFGSMKASIKTLIGKKAA